MQKVLILSDINSAHTQRWVSALLQHHIEVAVFSLSRATFDVKTVLPNLIFFGEVNDAANKPANRLAKALYLVQLPRLKRCIDQFKPDIVHAHYASSYGLLGALSGFRPFFVSVWGSDVLVFPNKSSLHRKIISYTLGKADQIMATSKLLSDQVMKLSNRSSTVIPFGVDTQKFFPHKTQIHFDSTHLVVGTVKSMEPIYRIDWIIRAFAKVQTLRPDISLRLLIVGGGSQLRELKLLAQRECRNKTVVFTDKVSASEIPDLMAQLDIFVHAAVAESFGVSTLEAAACGKPAVLCNSGGVSEVAEDGTTALFYAENDFDGLTDLLLKLVDDALLRDKIGTQARKFVVDNFDWKKNVADMISLYSSTLNNRTN